jgi:hypothetical protein
VPIVREFDLTPKPPSYLAKTIIHELLGKPAASVRLIPVGLMNWKYLVTMPSGDEFIVRFYPKSRTELVRFEPDLIRRCRDAGMSVPEIIADSRTGPQVGWEYSMYRMLPGISFAEREAQLSEESISAIAQEIYHQMLLISGLNVAGFGDLNSAGAANCDTWRNFIEHSFFEGLPIALQVGRISKGLAKDLEFILHKLDSFKAPESAVAWGDMSPSNIILDRNDRLVGIIDFEGALAAEMALSIGYLKAGFDGTFFCRSIENIALSDAIEPTRRDLYVIVRALRILKHGARPLPLGRSRDPIDKFLPGFFPAVNRLCRVL